LKADLRGYGGIWPEATLDKNGRDMPGHFVVG